MRDNTQGATRPGWRGRRRRVRSHGRTCLADVACRGSSGRSRTPLRRKYSNTSGCGKIRNDFRVETGDHRVGNGFRFEHAVDTGDAAAFDPRGHRGVDGLRREHRYLQSLFAIGDREPFRERQRRVLGDRIRRTADLREQPRGRRSVQEVAAAALDHPRHERSRRVHVRHHIDLDAELPLAVGSFLAARDDDARVRAEEVDRPVPGLGDVDERADVAFFGDVARARRARPTSLDHLLQRLVLNVGDHDTAGAFGRKAAGERGADAGRGTGNDDCTCLHTSWTWTPSSAIGSTMARPPLGSEAATCSARAGSTNAAAVGPDPESHAACTRRPRARRRSRPGCRGYGPGDAV